ncbi:MAG: vitamin B12 dependent methionine synthase [Clostridia bacterium]|nr:vitamin B12 dependent methionine synthase [Clostridia bacterium]
MELNYVSISYEGEYDALLRRLHINEDLEDEFRQIYEDCLAIARPKGVFSQCPVVQEGGVTVVGGHAFQSRVLSTNFRGRARVFPYVITCGRELYDFAQATEDPLGRYWIDSISEAALRAVGAQVRQAVRDTYGLGPVSSVNPGSLRDFPLPCQRPLFDLLGEGPSRIGLELTPSFLMLPYKSGSGIYFESEERYENCALCPRLDCPGRRMPYSEALVHAYGLQEEGQSGPQA